MRRGALAWLLFAAGLLTFGNSLHGVFVFDDLPAFVQADPLLAPAQSPLAGRPVAGFTLWLNRALGGEDLAGYHAVNVAVHLLAGLVLFGIARRALGSGAPAFAWALVWLVHPLQTECVNYVTQRTESIAGLFYLLTIYAARRADEGLGWRAAAIAACALGMATKETMVTAPVLVVLLDVVLREEPLRSLVRRRAGLWAALGSTWLVLLALAISGPRSGTVGLALEVGPWDYALTQSRVILHYLRLFVWPHPLAIDYGQPEPTSLAAVAWPAVTIVLLVAASVALLVRRPRLGLLPAAFWLLLLPSSSFVPITSEMGAERRMYLPLAALVGLCLLAAQRIGLRRSCGALLLTAVALPLSAASFRRNLDYRSALELWRGAASAWPENPRAHNNLGAELQLAGRIDEAERHYRRAIELSPRYPGAHYNLANVLAAQDRLAEAVAEYETAVAQDPRSAATHNNLGIALERLGRVEEGIAHYRRALELDPALVQAQENLERDRDVPGRPR